MCMCAKKKPCKTPPQNKQRKKQQKANQNTNAHENFFSSMSVLEVLFIFTKAFNKNLNWITGAMEEIFSSGGV